MVGTSVDGVRAEAFEKLGTMREPCATSRSGARTAPARRLPSSASSTGCPRRNASGRTSVGTVERVAERPDGDGAAAPSTSAEERRRFACPPARGRYQELELEYLDPADPDERRILLEAEHPELRHALRRGDDEVVGDGRPNPRLHLAMHEIVANQLWDDDPPEAWETGQRLLALGYERHEVLHMLGSVVAREVWSALTPGVPSDPRRYVAVLRELPESYFALAEEP